MKLFGYTLTDHDKSLLISIAWAAVITIAAKAFFEIGPWWAYVLVVFLPILAGLVNGQTKFDSQRAVIEMNERAKRAESQAESK